jgi:hypothetical protein
MPFERPLHDAGPSAHLKSMRPPTQDDPIDVSALLAQTFVDQARLADNIRSLLPERSSSLLTDILDFYPVEQGVAEILGYLSLAADDITVTLDDDGESVVDYEDLDGCPRRARLPLVTVSRR